MRKSRTGQCVSGETLSKWPAVTVVAVMFQSIVIAVFLTPVTAKLFLRSSKNTLTVLIRSRNR